MTQQYATTAPERETVDAIAGPAVLEFGANWCGICRAAQPVIAEAFAGYPQMRHTKIEDGSGRPLGRSFGVKLWPTLIFLRDGKEIARVVRPQDAVAMQAALADISA